MNAQQARERAMPKEGALAGPPLRLVHSIGEESHLLPTDHGVHVDQPRPVGGQPLDPDQTSHDLHWTPVEVEPSSHPIIAAPATTRDTSGWLELRIWAEMFSDAQLARIAATNRAERGGVDPALYVAYLDTLKATEHACGLSMKRCMRRVVPPAVREWQKANAGIGEHQLALLLGHLGHPRIAAPHHWEGTGSNRTLITDEPYERSISQLWQYCGHGKPDRKRKGMTADDLAAQGKPRLKAIVWNIACACLKAKATSPYGKVYDDAREQYADRVHADECVRCGPSGKPAQPGSPWSPAHQHAAALRKVGKEVLRDLWLVA